MPGRRQLLKLCNDFADTGDTTPVRALAQDVEWVLGRIGSQANATGCTDDELADCGRREGGACRPDERVVMVCTRGFSGSEARPPLGVVAVAARNGRTAAAGYVASAPAHGAVVCTCDVRS